MHTIKRLGQNICKLRVNARRTQYQLSDAARMDRSYLQRIEAGRSSPTAITLVRIKKVLNCSWDDLFLGVNDGVDAMASAPQSVSPRQLRKSGGVNRTLLEKIIADLDTLVQESGDADKFDLQELQQAQFILRKIMARSVLPP